MLKSQRRRAIDIKTHNQYHSPRIFPTTLDPSPLAQFQHWFAEALNPTDDSIPQVKEPEAMCISTATAEGVPSSRFVLLKHVDSHGFVFFTNYDSRKSQELLANPYASIAFYWKEVSRQIRVVGKVEKVARKESEDTLPVDREVPRSARGPVNKASMWERMSCRRGCS